MSEYSTLPKESFLPTSWLGPGGLEGVSPRWQGYSVDLPQRGTTSLYPLRNDSFGVVLPHIYAGRMNGQGKNDPLTRLNLQVNMLYELNGSLDYDSLTNNFESLLRGLGRSPYDEQPELVEELEEVFASYKGIREAARVKTALALSHTIRQAELYVVAADSADWDTQSDHDFYTACLAGIINVRRGSKMNYRIVARDFDGNEGFLPEGFYVPGGVSAPAA